MAKGPSAPGWRPRTVDSVSAVNRRRDWLSCVCGMTAGPGHRWESRSTTLPMSPSASAAGAASDPSLDSGIRARRAD